MFIIGARKGGTTSLYHYLSTHPGFKKAKNKEIHYFSSRFSKEVGWYARNFPTEDECQQAVTWEASVATSAAVRPHTRKECWFHLKIFSFPFPLLLPEFEEKVLSAIYRAILSQAVQENDQENDQHQNKYF